MDLLDQYHRKMHHRRSPTWLSVVFLIWLIIAFLWMVIAAFALESPRAASVQKNALMVRTVNAQFVSEPPSVLTPTIPCTTIERFTNGVISVSTTTTRYGLDVSEDGGRTWQELLPVEGRSNYSNVVIVDDRPDGALLFQAK